MLVRGRRTITRFALGLGILTVGIVLVRPRDWTVESSFRPQGANASMSQLSSVAAQFGVNVPNAGQGEMPQFYEELIMSRALLSRVSARTYTNALPKAATLAEILEVDEDDPEVRTAKVIEWLRESAIRTGIGRETGVMTVKVTTEWPRVSMQLSHAILEELNRFNTETRRSQATSERAFVQQRLSASRAELLRAEGVLRSFVQANRAWPSSPELRFEHDRLERDVAVRQQVFTSLSTAFEEARISEVRDTPVITILQEPYVPPEPDKRGLVLKAVLGTLLGAIIGALLAFLRQLRAPVKHEERRAYDEVQAFISALKSGRLRELV